MKSKIRTKHINEIGVQQTYRLNLKRYVGPFLILAIPILMAMIHPSAMLAQHLGNPGYVYAQQLYPRGGGGDGVAPFAFEIQTSTGKITYSWPNSCPNEPCNAQHIAVVGNLMYYTHGTGTDKNVYVYSLVNNPTNAASIAFTVTPSAHGVGALAFDGADFWVAANYYGDYHVFHYTPSGSLKATITLAPGGNGVINLDYFAKNGTLVATQYGTQNIWNQYNTSGGLVKSGFIDISGISPPYFMAGLAWNGTYFYSVNDIAGYGPKLEWWTSSGGTTPAGSVPITGWAYSNGMVVDDVAVWHPTPCLPPPANMVAWYPFDWDGVPQQQDLTSYNNTGTAYGNYTTIYGEVSNALQFDGASAYVQAPAQPQLNMGTRNFSIDAWVKIANSADYSGVVVLLDKRDSYTGYHMYIYNGKPGLQLADPSGYTNYTSTATIPADNQWHLLAVTVVRNSHTGGTWYLDGLPVGNFDPTARTGSLNSVAPLVIGVRSANQGGYGYFKGGVDELEIFNRALSSAEVLSLMRAGSAGKCKQSAR